jgi:hypothetical protein
MLLAESQPRSNKAMSGGSVGGADAMVVKFRVQ